MLQAAAHGSGACTMRQACQLLLQSGGPSCSGCSAVMSWLHHHSQAQAQSQTWHTWLHQHHQQRRGISEQQLNADGAQVADLFEKNMAKASRKRDSNAAPRILTTRREALHLYREILRYSNLFVWRDDKGRMWRDVLRANARKEFEDARLEPDPEIINKLIITGRDAVQRVVETFWKRRNAIIEDEAKRQQQGGDGSAPPMR